MSATAKLESPSLNSGGTGGDGATQDPFSPDREGNYPSCIIISGVSDPSAGNLIIESSFSSMPVIWESELSQEYLELGDALSELTEVESDDGMGIERPVFEAATNIATELMANAFPAPRVFTHGPKSVVFNWTRGIQSLYLTISADKVSALMSVPAEIQRRIDYPLDALINPALVLKSLESANRLHPVALLSASVSESSKIIS